MQQIPSRIVVLPCGTLVGRCLVLECSVLALLQKLRLFQNYC